MASNGLPLPQVYLAPNFEPSSLKVAQLRGILYAHDVQVPSTAKKADLVKLFEDRVRPGAKKLLSDASTVRPSSVGITEIGHDGEPIPVPKPPKGTRQTKTRKSSLPTPEPLSVDVDIEADGEEEDNDVDVVEAKKNPPRRTTRRSIAASGSPPSNPTPMSQPSTARKTRRSVANLVRPIRDEFSPSQDNVQVVVPSTVTKAARKKPSVAILREESEPEDEKDKGGPKAGKFAEDISAPVVARTVKGRKSVMLQEDRDGEGNTGNFSDFNPFQSGGEASPGMGVAEGVRFRKKRQTLGGPERVVSSPSKANRRKSEPGMSHVALALASPERSPVKSTAIAITPPSLKKFQPELGKMRTPPEEWKRSRLSEVLSEEQHLGNAQTTMEPDDEYDDIPVQESDLALYQQYNPKFQDDVARVANQEGKPQGVKSDDTKRKSDNRDTNGDLNESTVTIVHSTRDIGQGNDDGAAVKLRGNPLAWKNLRQLAYLLLAVTVVFPAMRTWQKESAQIGYCDTGSNLNSRILEDRQRRAKLVEWKTQAVENPHDQVSARPNEEAFYEVFGIAPPESCTPCPDHATCRNGKLAHCEQGYQLVRDWRENDFVKMLFDGLPGVGPIAFPPNCHIDFKRKALGAMIAKEIEADLAKRRGDVLCSKGLWSADNADDLADAARVIRNGMSEQDLKDMLFTKMKLSETDFHEQFEIAIKDLLAYNNIQAARENGTTYYAATRSVVPATCAIRLKAVNETKKHKKELGWVGMMASLSLLLQNWLKKRKVEDAQVKELVAISLAKLQDKKHLYYAEPEVTSEAYLRPDQMRDDVLVLVPQAKRTHIWARVQSVVERNANVQVAEEELFGDVWKTWEWTGSTRKDLQDRSMFPVA
ncbi:hypothetical protein NliqN6_1962 [Naganishia liquefaciens]|uniref:Uncharacterized protein n=1 Tax=Naganishia liquefaciens TaxID=104408 RepID=A0A8H3TS07_9TREE|nr:hypothetical protein NliqN6_1962 [Naganishia liquefaciens]